MFTSDSRFSFDDSVFRGSTGNLVNPTRRVATERDGASPKSVKATLRDLVSLKVAFTDLCPAPAVNRSVDSRIQSAGCQNRAPAGPRLQGMTTAVSVRGLRKQYPGHLAVAGIDLDIAQGEVFSLLGPNGAGKTTTVEILEGHRLRTDGEATVLGEDPGKAGRAWRARIGIVLQTANDAAELTVAETVRHFAKYYPNPRDPEEVIEKVGLTEKAGTRIKSLSGGQRRRVD